MKDLAQFDHKVIKLLLLLGTGQYTGASDPFYAEALNITPPVPVLQVL